MASFRRIFRFGGPLAWGLLGAVALTAAASTALLGATAEARWRRDVSRMVFNDNMELLRTVREQAGGRVDTLRQLLAAAPDTPASTPYLVVSTGERRLWYKQGDSVLFTTQVATGSGKTLEREGAGATHWKFETPRGRLVVLSKDSMPVWVPPEWHFVEQARKRGLGLVRMTRDQTLRAADGSVIAVSGSDLVRRTDDGSEAPLTASDGREIVVGGNLIVPPFGTNQRKYKDVLGTRRLNLGDGYALHGTNRPETIGQAVSHGCVRLRNEDVEWLYDHVPVGTAVYIY